MYFIAILH
ncbi:hypothetical protein MTR67_026303 [Solanum verrucosum]|uniref:Uncharacterized protein n=1 Tax=Solanum verrucosum TaxID=315347 RepID=A0AAF0TZQ1_SOLVR|nr:hypothetical protein MTR67_026303 [Solanum verrucosum]